ncbi:lipopolysaccharide export system protein LptA [Cognatiyoonia koreensis]|uniref:Lipopolysaccharide export system protein LptA n=1 Tax=Cognatiyoonia koreensis TaxID=364200 RepID=A0A1I0RMD0_9RHOB|nr:lipopolysaccharide transport periplasmic protein LptA [Cognatiyoonia koreensis]SEW42337.1 lipopolysaccharide export system protein LptA [Cognatiyoonia koreensis]
MVRVLSVLAILCLASPILAQTNINLGGISADPSAPVEVAADSLTVDQDTGTAIFTGNVRIGQGDLRLSAASVEVVYGAETGEITRLKASGGVTFATATEAAEAQSADYDIAGGTLVLTGDVLLSQGASAITAEQMTVNLTTGNAQMSGRVRTVFQQGDN